MSPAPHPIKLDKSNILLRKTKNYDTLFIIIVISSWGASRHAYIYIYYTNDILFVALFKYEYGNGYS